MTENLLTIAQFANKADKTVAQIRWKIKTGEIQIVKLGLSEGWAQYRVGIDASQLEKLK